ncbi:MAG: hypothetical protein JRF61_05465 [Deltaproteobacteria bacterium]|nr:hypothetical protein [Deltaproteobacteria bacterium]
MATRGPLFRILHRDHRRAPVAALVAACLVAASVAFSADYPLRSALDDSVVADFGVVRVDEDGQGGLLFTVWLNPDTLGRSVDLHRLYFNLEGPLVGLSGVTEDEYRTPYEIIKRPPVAGGGGIEFDVAIDFGKGAGKKGNGVLQQATFHVHTARPLSLEDVGEESATAGGSLFGVAVHVQGSDLSSVVGVFEPPPPSPEPGEQPDDSDPCNGGIFTCVPRDP